MENILKSQETIIIQQKTYYITHTTKIIINPFVQTYKKTNTIISQQFNCIEKLEENNDKTMLFIAEKQQKNILNCSLDSLKSIE